MAHCTNCYGTNTTTPCDSVGCLSTNYGKCITYSGSNLYCAAGSIATFTFTGTAVSPTVSTTVTVSATGGSGTGATFVVTRTAGETTYTVTLEDAGSAYEVTDELTIAGTDLGGTSPTNDITITVATLAAVIANGDNLDVIISNLNQRLCLASEASPTGLDYTAFNYSCLREGGNLEGVGTVITTAQGFVEATAAALCALNVRVSDVEVPGITVDSYFSSTLTSGTSTLVEILNAYGEAIGDLNDKFTINTSATCGTFTNFTNFTTKPSSTASLGTWFDWVHSNMCTIYGEIDNYLTNTTNQFIDINTALFGLGTSFPSGETLYVDTSCLSGGSATDRVMTGLQLVTDELCSLITTVSGLSTPSYTVDWSCFTTPYASNSVFGVQSLGSFTGTTTLQTHLDQIADALSNLNLNFSSEFTVTNSSCGPVISLAGGSTFTCSSLSSCSINNLGDVNASSATNGQFLTYNSAAGEWQNTDVDVTINSSSSNVTKTVTTSGTTFDLNISAAVSGTSYYYRTSSPGYGNWTIATSSAYPITKPSASGWPYLAITGSVGHFIGGFRLDFSASSTFSPNVWRPSLAYSSIPYTLDSEIVVPAFLHYYSTSGGAFTQTYDAIVKIYPGGTGTFSIEWMYTGSAPFSYTSGDALEVVIPSLTFTVS